jgi:poly-beta-hydroxybutyrate-responsive repressor
VVGSGKNGEMMEIEVQPRNWLIAAVLVMLQEEGSYGYELMELLEEGGFGQINPGTLYRKLRQMEREGLCKSEWETSEEGPGRRVYTLTDAGDEYLEAWAQACKHYQQVMDAFYQAYADRPPRS